MKTLYGAALLLMATMLFSCEKNIPLPNYWGLPGKWAYSSTNCNCAVNSVESITNTTNQPDILTFTPKSYQRFVGGQLQSSGTYTVVNDTVQYSQQVATRIIYDGNTTAPKTFFRLSGNTLTLFSDTPITDGSIEINYVSQ